MKKSTMLIIFIVYVASIVVIGFFGMRVKVYDEVKYIKSIQMSVEAENENMFTLSEPVIDPTTKNPKYTLRVNFISCSLLDANNNRYLPLNLIPKIEYDTGEIEGSNLESITYTVSNEKLIEDSIISLDERGTLICREKLSINKNGEMEHKMYSFFIYVKPASMSGIGTGADILVIVV